MVADKKNNITAKQDTTKNPARLEDNDKNYKIMFIANAILSFADGLYYPFLIGFLYNIGNIPLTGAGLGLILIFDSIGSYFAGKWADKYDKKLYFLLSSIVSIIVFIAYPLLPLLERIDHNFMLIVLFALVFIDGITDGAWDTIEAIYLADITSKASRSNKMGFYWGAGGAISGVAMLSAGFLGLHINFLTAALIVVLIYLSGFLMLLRIKEIVDKK